jgi:transcriptional regulator with XRE-family HTH domain
MNATERGDAGIRAARLAAGLSQQRLAELARCSVGYVRILENGYEPETGEVYGRVLAVLDGASDSGPTTA